MFPRPGRQEADGFMWLWRVFDKARAAADGTIHDYIYPCPMDRGVFERWGITPAQFEEALRTRRSDAEILAWLKEHVGVKQRDAANAWLSKEKSENLNRQDAEEGVIAA